MNSKRIDLFVGTGLSVFSVAVFLYAQGYKGKGVNQYGPDFFPQFLSVMMFCAAVVLVVNALRGHAKNLPDKIEKEGFIRAAVTLGIAVAYLLLMQLVGFIISTFLFLFVLMAFIGQKGWILRLISSLAVTGIVYSLFYYFLKIPIPNGIIF